MHTTCFSLQIYLSSVRFQYTLHIPATINSSFSRATYAFTSFSQQQACEYTYVTHESDMTACWWYSEWSHGGVLCHIYVSTIVYCSIIQVSRVSQAKMLCRNCKDEVEPRNIRAHLAVCPAKQQNMMALFQKFVQTMSNGRFFPKICCLISHSMWNFNLTFGFLIFTELLKSAPKPQKRPRSREQAKGSPPRKQARRNKHPKKHLLLWVNFLFMWVGQINSFLFFGIYNSYSPFWVFQPNILLISLI